MSGIEDSQDASEQDDTREEATETAGDDSKGEVATEEESDSPENSPGKLPTKDSREEREKLDERLERQAATTGVIREQITEEERTTEEGAAVTPSREDTRKQETSEPELATITRSASSDDGAQRAPVSGIGGAYETRQAEPRGPRDSSRTGVGPASASSTVDDGNGRRSGPGAAVGEWNSLPVLVERLREALELSLTSAGCRRGSGDEPTATTSLAVSGGDRSLRTVHRRCLERALLHDEVCDHEDPAPTRKEELKFLEDLLLSDIQTALARLRETLERTDVATLAKHGGVSDPSSKLHLLRLVSSLLSRLQVPEQVRESAANGDGDGDERTAENVASARRRRAVGRHTIGVSTEELARARRQLEESSVDLARLNDQLLPPQQRRQRHVDEIHDKYTKDVINQRQSLRDKNKDKDIPCGGDTVGVPYRNALVPPQIGYVTERPLAASETSSAHQPRQRRGSVDTCQEKKTDSEETARRTSEEQSQVTKLAAVLRQRAELISSGKCANGPTSNNDNDNDNNNNNNKFTAKKSKIKRANTVDIPSYLKLQAGSSYANPCVLLRRPINVGDKINANTVSQHRVAVVPSFHPRTENDKKFLALISRNNDNDDAQPFNATPAFVKSFGYTKTTDMSSLTNENWNSRFSNIKTAFDRPSTATNDGNRLVPKPTIAPLTSPRITKSKKTAPAANGLPFANPNDSSMPAAGFRHAPSSLFRKIEKPQSPKPAASGHHWQRDNSAQSSGITLREKAKIMFDRDGNKPVQFQAGSRFVASERSHKSTFPRPPWLEHDTRHKSVTENGRLDYRQFCKQFAPFIGKGNPPTSPEPKGSQPPSNIEEPRKRDGWSVARRDDLAPANDKLGVVDGKISIRMFPERGGPQQRPQRYRAQPSEPRRAEEATGEKFDPRSEKDTFALSRDNEQQPANRFPGFDATTLKGSSSVAIQTGVNVNDDHPEEARVFRVAPRAPPFASYNNASVQTQSESEAEPWLMPPRPGDNPTSDSSRYRPVEDPRRLLVLDHNQNCRVLPQGPISPLMDKNACGLLGDGAAGASNSTNPAVSLHFATRDYHSPPEQSGQAQQTNPQYETCFPNAEPPTLDDRSSPMMMYANYALPYHGEPAQRERIGKEEDQPSSVWPPDVPDEIDRGDLSRRPAERHIQNQDISVDAGVVTRYTCAIATVATTDVPQTTTGAEPEEASSPTSRPSVQVVEDVATNEDEIRRHNMLQQSLVRRLQNERAVLCDHRAPPIAADQSGNPSQAGGSNQSRLFNQLNNFNQPARFQPSEAPKRPEPPRKLEPPKILEPSSRQSLKPPAVVGPLSVTPSSGISATNRVTALREQYEQPSERQTRPSVHKERSPIPNGVGSSMDSSDEYLVSCVNKPSRSIVLSKSESWHQLALSSSQHCSLRVSHDGGLSLPPPPLPSSSSLSSSSSSSSSHLLKPPKPKSPSSFKMKKQYEASSSSDSVKRMEDKIRRYFDNPGDSAGVADTHSRDPKGKGSRFSSRDSARKGLIGLSRSRTMPGVYEERLHLTIPPAPSQIPAGNLNTAEVEKVFDDIFEEATKADDHRF